MNRAEAKKKAEALVAQMDVLEAAAQLRYDAPALDRLNIPEYNWWNEALHGVARAGVATSFPQAIGMAAAFDPEMVEQLGDIAATEGRAKYNAVSKKGDRDIYKGLTFWSPNINIFRDPRWGRGHETYGEDPTLTTELGKAYIRGLQGDGEYLKTAACAKHFAVHSGPEADRHHFNVNPSKKDLEETYLPAFEAAVKEADVESVMGAYNAVNGYPCCGSPELLQEYLREKWGFQGHVVSDCWAINDFHANHHFTDTPAESSAAALKAGTDLNCGCTYRCLLTALAQKLITEDDIRQAAIRLFTTRYLLGIMDGQETEFDNIPYSAVECKEHVSAAIEAAEKGIVLLKNDGILPLDKKKLRSVGVVGPNANSRAALIGNYHGTSSRYITVLEGIQDELGEDVRVYYSEGCHLFKDRVQNLGQADDRLAEAQVVADQSDVVVLVLGLDETLEGEEGDTGNADASGDKLSLLLPESQRKLAKAVLDTGKPVILCLMAGSAIDVSEIADRAAAVVQLWYPGARGGKAAADVLFGKRSPSGKLPVTFYYNTALEEMPAFTDYSMKNRTYRYYTGKPLYPFGYGLTYGDTKAVSVCNHGDTVKVLVRNDGRETEDVLQVYVKDMASEDAPVNPVLQAFQRVHLNQGEEREITLKLPARAFQVCSQEGQWVPGSGKWTVYASFGQPDARTQELTGKKAASCIVESSK
ncbi:MAG: glycoside hydrolase family 3 C-terminal domain-containing protein [Candidatus Faecousia sp.]|nr:glycoside hydrolase family 3 C-terminal domain-containing protein [Candidatus Faecousia sp.]